MGTDSFQRIKNRMIKKAASIWGVPANEIESSFDPLVSLLISASASEILRIESQLKEAQSRVTEKFIELMTPETVVGAKPAHAILYANTIDPINEVKPECLFFHKRRVVKKSTQVSLKNIFFSPVQKFKLIQANVNYLVSGTCFHTYLPKKEKQLLASGEFLLPESTLYLGITTRLKELVLDDISLYFELEDIEQKDLFFHYLKYSQCFVDDTPINFSSGFYNTETSVSDDLHAIFNDESSKMRNINNRVLRFYEQNYITFKHKDTLKNYTRPPEIDHIMTDRGLDVPSNTLWLKFVFPTVLSNNVLQQIFCSFNAIPVLNRELNKFTYQIKDYIHIVPVRSKDLFLDIHSVSNTNGKNYVARQKSMEESSKGTYMLKSNAVAKLDQRGAKELLVYLIELLKDESASFSFMGNDFLHTNLRQLNQQISLLEKKVSNSGSDEYDTNYLALEPYAKKETIIVEYWSTSGDEGNAIKSGTDVEVYKAIGIRQKGAYLLTTSFEGKNKPSISERTNAYRRALLSRERIVTKADIKALCTELFGNNIKEVRIERGHTNNIDHNKGVTPCIDIVISLKENFSGNPEELASLKSNLLLQLEKRSINLFPYQIKIVY